MLLKYSEKKLKALKDMKQLTIKQGKAIKDRNTEILNQLTMEKQQIIDQIDTYDDKFNIELRELKRMLGINNLDELNEVRDISDEKEKLINTIRKVLQLISEIKTQEETNYVLIKKAMEDTQNDIKKINAGKKALRGYNASVNTLSGGFVDKKK